MKYLILILILLTSFSTGTAQIPLSAQLKIDQLFSQINDSSPGYAIAVIRDNEFIVNKGYGLSNLEHGIPINDESVFNIASLSKQFTAAAIALLIIDKKISLEDEVSKYISDFPFADSEMKVKHLIYMTSGINDYYYNPRKNNSDWSGLHFFNIDTAIQASFNSAELMYAPGSQWSYSNINYMLLTKIVEKVAGISFSKFVQERLFRPLGMNNSFVNDDIFQIIPNRVLGYNYRDSENTNWLLEGGYLTSKGSGFLQINRNAPHYGGSGVYSSIKDLKKWTDNFVSRSLGGDEFYELMHQTKKFKHDKSNDAFGLAFGDFNGHQITWYEGGDWGFSSYFIRFVKQNITVLVLSNLGTGNARKYSNAILDILIEENVITL